MHQVLCARRGSRSKHQVKLDADLRQHTNHQKNGVSKNRSRDKNEEHQPPETCAYPGCQDVNARSKAGQHRGAQDDFSRLSRNPKAAGVNDSRSSHHEDEAEE